jgi:hypothetical protein
VIKRKKFCQKTIQNEKGETIAPALTQVEADTLYEGAEIVFTDLIQDTFLTYVIAVMYMSALPLGLLSALINFALHYVFLKYRLLKDHKMPPQIDSRTVMKITATLPWIVYISVILQLIMVDQARIYTRELYI